MLLSVSVVECVMAAVPFLITGALSVRLFTASKAAEAEPVGSKNLLFGLGVFFLIITLGIGTCFGMASGFRLE